MSIHYTYVGWLGDSRRYDCLKLNCHLPSSLTMSFLPLHSSAVLMYFMLFRNLSIYVWCLDVHIGYGPFYRKFYYKNPCDKSLKRLNYQKPSTHSVECLKERRLSKWLKCIEIVFDAKYIKYRNISVLSFSCSCIHNYVFLQACRKPNHLNKCFS